MDAARSVLRDSDFSAVSMADVADRAGVARPNLYRYFASKEELLAEVLLREVRNIHAKRHRALAHIGSVRERIIASLVMGAEESRRTQSVLALAGPLLDGVPALMAGDSDLLELEIEYWAPLLAEARAEHLLVGHLTDVRIIRWFMTCQYLMTTQRALVDGGIRSFVEDFVAGPVLCAAPERNR